MEAVWSSKMLVFYYVVLSLEGHDFYLHHHENHKTCIAYSFLIAQKRREKSSTSGSYHVWAFFISHLLMWVICCTKSFCPSEFLFYQE